MTCREGSPLPDQAVGKRKNALRRAQGERKKLVGARQVPFGLSPSKPRSGENRQFVLRGLAWLRCLIHCGRHAGVRHLIPGPTVEPRRRSSGRSSRSFGGCRPDEVVAPQDFAEGPRRQDVDTVLGASGSVVQADDDTSAYTVVGGECAQALQMVGVDAFGCLRLDGDGQVVDDEVDLNAAGETPVRQLEGEVAIGAIGRQLVEDPVLEGASKQLAGRFQRPTARQVVYDADIGEVELRRLDDAALRPPAIGGEKGAAISQ